MTEFHFFSTQRQSRRADERIELHFYPNSRLILKTASFEILYDFRINREFRGGYVANFRFRNYLPIKDEPAHDERWASQIILSASRVLTPKPDVMHIVADSGHGVGLISRAHWLDRFLANHILARVG